MPSEMFEHMDYGAHSPIPSRFSSLGTISPARHFRHEFIDLLHDPAGAEKPRTRAHDGYLRVKRSGAVPAVDCPRKSCTSWPDGAALRSGPREDGR
jgi:hypothetical protein